VNCELACHLFDEYLEGQLSQYDLRRLERHLHGCPSCAAELRDLPHFERVMRRALAASTQGRMLSPEASMELIQNAQASLRRGIWSNRAFLSLRMVVVAAALCLVAVGLYFVLNDASASPPLHTTVLAPVRQLVVFEPPPAPSSELGPAALTAQVADSTSEGQGALSLTSGDVQVEPVPLQPGKPFTITLYLHSNMTQPVDRARFDLEVTGPTGYYRFEMKAKGPFPAEGVSVVQITPERLAGLSQEKYLISPEEVFSLPGVYVLRVLLYSPLAASTR
jgi:hypothetical protein